jgi:protein TonB
LLASADVTSRNRLTLALLAALALAGCAERPRTAAPASEADAQAPVQVAPAAIPALTLDGYKREVAARIAASNPHLFSDPLPEMFKSIVVLDITIDRHGNVARVAVRRSNGYKALESRAMESVREAAPYAAPTVLVRRGEGSVRFLETFLFRDDGRFQIRSLVGA